MSVSQIAERGVSYDLPAMEGYFPGSSLDLVASAPQGVAKLRKLILSLAVRGKLVPQDSSDEHADMLLARVRAEKDRLIAMGKMKRDRPLPRVNDDEKTFEIPSGWAWARVNHVSDNRLGKMLDKAKNAGKLYPYLRNTNVQWHRIELDDIKQIRLEDNEVDEYRLASGDLLVCEGGYPGRCAIWRETNREMFFQKALHRVRPLGGIKAEYLEICLRLDSDSGALERYFTGATIKHFAGQELNRYAFPLPPVAEQARIVARVEELMQLCDALEAHGRLQEEQHARLVATLFDALAASESAHALAESWQRIAAHFDLLLDRPEAVDALEQTILQLAVRGLLVSQDSSDEPAAALVAKIEREKVVVGGRRIRKLVGKLPPVGEGEIGFPAPAGWAYVRFGDVTINRDGERIPVSASDREGRAKSYDYYGASGVIDKIDGYLFDKRLLLIGEDGANLINRSTPIAFFAEGKYWVNNHAHVIDASDPKILDYLCLYINAISLAPYVTGTAQPKMNQAKLNGIPVALPPLAEQLRIVARVEELRRLCADLRERLQQAHATQSRLADALVSSAAQHADTASVAVTH